MKKAAGMMKTFLTTPLLKMLLQSLTRWIIAKKSNKFY
jgi:hypothetical protein